MSWTSHDQLFGWVHGLRLNRNNYFFGGKDGINERPYPVIIAEPSVTQVLSNWNRSDSGLVLSSFFLGLFVARRQANKDLQTDSIIDRRGQFRRYHRLFIAFGVILALRNSYYRLEGYVPNGLPKNDGGLVKYDFTSELVNGTFWRFFVESHDKPELTR